jgi:hypothetical protein
VSRRIEQQVRIFYTIPPNVKVVLGPTKPSEFTGYDALTITFDGGDKKKTYDFLLAKDGKTLLRMTKLDLSKDPFAEIMKKIDVNGRPTRGNSQAKVVAVNYDDFECPFCSRMHQTLFPTLLKEYGDRVVFIYKDFPLAEIHLLGHPCRGERQLPGGAEPRRLLGFRRLHACQPERSEFREESRWPVCRPRSHRHGARTEAQPGCGQTPGLSQSATGQPDKSFRPRGRRSGRGSYPDHVINGEKVDGALPIDDLRAVLDRALVQAGQTPPVHPAAAPAGAAQPGSK